MHYFASFILLMHSKCLKKINNVIKYRIWNFGSEKGDKMSTSGTFQIHMLRSGFQNLRMWSSVI